MLITIVRGIESIALSGSCLCILFGSRRAEIEFVICTSNLLYWYRRCTNYESYSNSISVFLNT